MNTRAFSYIVLAAIVFIPISAYAQMVGVTPDVGAQAFETWMQASFLRPLIAIGFIITGIVMAVGRHTFEGVVFCLIGASVAVGSDGLASIISGGR